MIAFVCPTIAYEYGAPEQGSAFEQFHPVRECAAPLEDGGNPPYDGGTACDPEAGTCNLGDSGDGGNRNAGDPCQGKTGTDLLRDARDLAGLKGPHAGGLPSRRGGRCRSLPRLVTGFFDVRARVVECAHCGAPLLGSSGQQIVCTYCGSANHLVARPEDGRRAPSAAEEIVRLSQLKAQESHPVAGHAYDLSLVPATLGAFAITEAHTNDPRALLSAWPHAKQAAPRGIEDQRALVWLAVHCARVLSDDQRPAEARARLETTLHLLQDAGHRQLVRAELATEAIEAGELAAAEAWLGECDAAASVLELDSAHRYARAQLCIAHGDVSGAYALIGAAPGTIPWSRTHALRGELLRVHLLEQTGNLAGAKTRWQQAKLKQQGSGLLDTACQEKLAPRTRRESAIEEAVKERTTIGATKGAKTLALDTLWRVPLLAFLLAFLTMIEGCTTQMGPLLGTTGFVICPAICESCEPPLSYQFWSTSTGSRGKSSEHATFCDTPSIKPSTMDASGRMRHYLDFPHQTIPFGAFTLAALSFVLLTPLAIPLALALALRKRRKLLPSRDAAKERLARLTREVDDASEIDRSYAKALSGSWRFAVVFVAASLAFSAAWLGLAVVLVPDPPASTQSR